MGTAVTPPPSASSSAVVSRQSKPYDFLLKFLLVGDSDVGKEEILSGLVDGSSESPYGINYKTTVLLLDGKRIKLQLWDTSGQGRFCTIFRSYSRGAQGIVLVYDITNRWSFDGIDRWIKEIDEHAPGVPKILVGNRCHLAFKREVSELVAEEYAQRHDMAFLEVSPLCNFNVMESLAALSRVALQRNGMSRTWGCNKVLSLQELCCRTIAARTTIYSVDLLPLPTAIKAHLKSYLLTSNCTRSTSLVRSSLLHRGASSASSVGCTGDRLKKHRIIRPSDSPPFHARTSCIVS